MVEKRLTRSAARLTRSCARHQGTSRKLLTHTALDTFAKKRRASKHIKSVTKSSNPTAVTEQPNTPHLDIILFHRPGESISIPYTDMEPISQILHRIRARLDFNPLFLVRHDLYVNGRLITNNHKSIAYYRIFGRIFTYRPRLSPSVFPIFIRTLTQKRIKLSPCTLHLAIHQVKQMIQDKEGVPPHEQRLLFGGKQLEDGRTLGDYSIYEDAIVDMCLILRGGGPGPAPGGISFSDVSDRSNVRKVGLVKSTKDTPPGLFVGRGTNVECNCACTPGYKVICREGFGTVELSEDRLMCPVCYGSDELVPVTVGFMECQYRFFGIKETGEQFTSEWTEVAKEDAYQQFLPDKQTTWKRLIIESADVHDSDKCTVCLEKLYEGAVTQACGHTFHSKCFDKWEKNGCPNCHFNQHLISCPFPDSA